MPKRNLVWIMALAAAAAVVLWVSRQASPPLPTGQAPDEFAAVDQTYRLICREYYRPVDEQRLRRGAVHGMVSSLDEFSTYISPGRVEEFHDRLRGQARGVGLRLERTGGDVTVIGPLPNSPAHRAGLLAGDRVLAIDQRPLEGLRLDQVEAMLCGPLGSAVTLTVDRGAGWRKDVELRRGEFPVESVEGLCRRGDGQWIYLVDPPRGPAYVRVREFLPDTARQLRELLEGLGPVDGLVLDLRDNPGGLLTSAIESVNLFLRGGVILTTVGGDGKRQEYAARPDACQSDAMPVVVLINARTASAAEVVAGALALHGRAVLVGTRTCGKGCLQSMIPLPDGLGQVNLTTAEMLLGTSRPILRKAGSDCWGVDPNPGLEVIVPQATVRLLEELRMRAEVLPAGEVADTSPSGGELPERMLAADVQLARALALLSDETRNVRAEALAGTVELLARPTATASEEAEE